MSTKAPADAQSIHLRNSRVGDMKLSNHQSGIIGSQIGTGSIHQSNLHRSNLDNRGIIKNMKIGGTTPGKVFQPKESQSEYFNSNLPQPDIKNTISQQHHHHHNENIMGQSSSNFSDKPTTIRGRTHLNGDDGNEPFYMHSGADVPKPDNLALRNLDTMNKSGRMSTIPENGNMGFGLGSNMGSPNMMNNSNLNMMGSPNNMMMGSNANFNLASNMNPMMASGMNNNMGSFVAGPQAVNLGNSSRLPLGAGIGNNLNSSLMGESLIMDNNNNNNNSIMEGFSPVKKHGLTNSPNHHSILNRPKPEIAFATHRRVFDANLANQMTDEKILPVVSAGFSHYVDNDSYFPDRINGLKKGLFKPENRHVG